MLADDGEGPIGLLRLAFQKLAGISINLLVALGVLFDERRGNPLDFKIPPPLVLDAVAVLTQRAGQLMVIDVLDELLGKEHVMVLQRLPAMLDWIERGIEHDAMGVQMWIEGARRVVTEHRSHDVASGSVGA